jgi:hypothetical protein
MDPVRQLGFLDIHGKAAVDGKGRNAGMLGILKSTISASGMPQALVLPEPVSAMATRSRPSRISTKVCSWMGVSSVKPISVTAFITSGLSPSSSNFMVRIHLVSTRRSVLFYYIVSLYLDISH